SGNGPRAHLAAFDLRDPVSAGVRGVLGTARGGKERSDLGHRAADGYAYRPRRVALGPFGFHRPDLLPIGAGKQGSGAGLAARSDSRMTTARTAESTSASRAAAYITLTKPDVSLLVLMTTAGGYYMGVRGPVNWAHLLYTVFGTMLIAAGTAALNHYIERESDRHMRRTAARPLPSGLLQPREALAFGVVLSLAGAAYLWAVAGWLAS